MSCAHRFIRARLLQRPRAAHVVLISLLVLFPVKAFATFSFSVSAGQIENALLLHFPLREYAIAARLTLSEPVVTLKQGATDLQLDIPLIASLSGEGRRRGRVTVAVGLHYKASTGELFLGTPQLSAFDLDGVTEDRRETFRASVADVLVKTLPMVRIYTVHERDLNHSLAKSVIKSMKIEDGVLWVSIGFD